jgi:hypothetical protein
VGYVAFVLGILAFLQTNDSRLKILNAVQSVVYAVHFGWLGIPSAAMSASVSAARNVASMKTRALWVAMLFIVANVALGLRFVKSPTDWLPIVGTCLSTVGFFMFRGIAMRLLLLSSTLCWLTNGVVTHSIGGTALESTIAVANVSTMLRMYFGQRGSEEPTTVSAE